MSIAEFIDNLPEDVSVVKNVLLDLLHENHMLKEQIKLLQHRKFGKKSEQYDDKQLDLFDEPEKQAAPPVEEETTLITINSHARKSNKKNRALPKNLPRKQIYYDLSEDEKQCACGERLNKFGEDTYEQLEYIPAKLNVIEHIKAKGFVA